MTLRATEMALFTLFRQPTAPTSCATLKRKKVNHLTPQGVTQHKITALYGV